MDFDFSLGEQIWLTMGMPFRKPMPNPPLDLTEKIKPALISYKAKIANQIGNRVSVSSATIPLKNGERLSRRSGMPGFIDHAPPTYSPS